MTGHADAARECAKELIARREHSVFELRRKLHQRGHADVAETVIESLTRVGLLDDERFARAWVSARTGRKAEGRRRLVAELIKRGVSDSVAAVVVEEELPVAVEQELLRSSASALRAGGHGRDAIARRLLARGFPAAGVRRAIAADDGWQ